MPADTVVRPAVPDDDVEQIFDLLRQLAPDDARPTRERLAPGAQVWHITGSRFRAVAGTLVGMAYAYPPQQMWSAPVRRASAPVALHVVAILQYLAGLASFAIGALLALLLSDAVPQLDEVTGYLGQDYRPAQTTAIVAVVCAVFGVVGLVSIVLGRKLQRGRNWARIVLTLLNALSVAAIASQWYSGATTVGQAVFEAFLPALCLVLLNTRASRMWCHHRTY